MPQSLNRQVIALLHPHLKAAVGFLTSSFFERPSSTSLKLPSLSLSSIEGILARFSLGENAQKSHFGRSSREPLLHCNPQWLSWTYPFMRKLSIASAARRPALQPEWLLQGLSHSPLRRKYWLLRSVRSYRLSQYSPHLFSLTGRSLYRNCVFVLWPDCTDYGIGNLFKIGTFNGYRTATAWTVRFSELHSDALQLLLSSF